MRHWLSNPAPSPDPDPNSNPNPDPNPNPNLNLNPNPNPNHSDLCVAVGLCTERFPLDGRMPGWDYHSCGFHGDDGLRFHGSGGNGNAFAEARGFEPGSVVGCGVIFDSHKVFHHHANNNGGSVVFYTVDGQLVGPAFMVPHLIRRRCSAAALLTMAMLSSPNPNPNPNPNPSPNQASPLIDIPATAVPTTAIRLYLL